MDRFFCPTLPIRTHFDLDDTESHHLAHVLRHKAGDQVELFDGQGNSAVATVRGVSKRSSTLQIEHEIKADEPRAIRITLAVAAPKGDRIKWLIEKATEIGVAELIPLVCERSVVDPGASKRAKLEQSVVVACKQCGRNDLMAIQPSRSFVEAVQKAGAQAWIADPTGEPIANCWSGLQSAERKELTILIGPEGGFTPEELSLAQAKGLKVVSLGRSILRVETAAVATAAFAMFGATGQPA
jgi:16S rRNA (uracil1498-N3)-methyltransferase